MSRASFDQLDRQAVGVFDHDRARVAEPVRTLHHLHVCPAQTSQQSIESEAARKEREARETLKPAEVPSTVAASVQTES